MIERIEKKENGIEVFRLGNQKIEVLIMNLGCTILQFKTKDKYGIVQDVVLGYENLEDYKKYDGYLGALVGRVANRIKHGKFTLNGKEYRLAINNGPNSLHGGIEGFSYKLFESKIENDCLILQYLSKDMEEGYPGNLTLKVCYQLIDDKLIVSYEAVCDQDALVNITNHSYFNLSGRAKRIDQHELSINADFFALIDSDGLVTGEYMSVTDTPFDFRTPKRIGNQLAKKHEQLEIGRGFDHPFVFSEIKDQVSLYCEETGLELIVSTTLPQAQIYSANYLDGRIGKNGVPMEEKSGICIETQMMPNDINLYPNNPKTLLRKGKRYEAMTSYQLRTRK